MYYRIDNDALYAQVDAEVSQAADAAYAEDGTSLYDTVVLTEKDRQMVVGLIADSLAQVVRKASDIAAMEDVAEEVEESTIVTPCIRFDVPDMDPSQEVAASDEITRFAILATCAALYQQRRSILVPEYASRAQAALDNAIALIRKRKTPSR